MNFEEFLKKEKQIMASDLSIARSAKQRFIESLGEWAWEQYLYWKEPQSKAYSKVIAIGCLGKKEFEKRLSLLSDCVEKRDK